MSEARGCTKPQHSTTIQRKPLIAKRNPKLTPVTVPIRLASGITKGLRYKNLTPTTAPGAPSAGPRPAAETEAIIAQAKTEALDNRTNDELITIMRRFAGSRNGINRLIGALASDTIIERFPELDSTMEAWVTDGSKGSYTETLIAALTELQTAEPTPAP